MMRFSRRLTLVPASAFGNPDEAHGSGGLIHPSQLSAVTLPDSERGWQFS